MVVRGKLHVVNVKSGQTRGERFEMLCVMKEAEVFLDLRVADVVPINHIWAVKLAEEKLEVAFQRNFLKRLPVFDAEFEAAFLASGRSLRNVS